MKYLLGFILLFALVSCGPNMPKPVQLQDNFAEAALPVLKTIERAHLHSLHIGEEPPHTAVDRLLSYADSDAERDVAKKLGDLLIIVEANSDEYLGCDTKIKAALLSRQWPDSFYPECK